MSRKKAIAAIVLMSASVLIGCKANDKYPAIYVHDDAYQISREEGIADFECNSAYDIPDGVFYDNEYYDVDGNVALPFYYFQAIDDFSDYDDFNDYHFFIRAVHEYYNDTDSCYAISVRMPQAMPLTQIRQSDLIGFYELAGYWCAGSNSAGCAYGVFTNNGQFDFENESFVQSDIYSEFDSDPNNYRDSYLYVDSFNRICRTYLISKVLDNECDFFVIVFFHWSGIYYETDLYLFSDKKEDIIRWADGWVPAGTLSETIESDFEDSRTWFE